MKKMRNLILLIFTVFALASCEEDYDTVASIDHIGGLINVDKGLISYVVGNDATYTMSGNVYQGAAVSTTSIELYKKFTSVNGDQSDTVLFKTISLDAASQTEFFNTSANYAELISGLTLNGAPLPADDSLLNIGDFWTITYKSITSEGNASVSASSTKISVATRFGGLYTVVTGEYTRIGVPRPDVSWTGDTVTIESVDAITYKHNGLAVWPTFSGVTNEYWFTLAGDQITVLPTTPSGDSILLNGEAITTCETNPSDLTNANCGASNYVVLDNVDGKDLIFITVGYLAASGAREFYEVLEKQI